MDSYTSGIPFHRAAMYHKIHTTRRDTVMRPSGLSTQEAGEHPRRHLIFARETGITLLSSLLKIRDRYAADGVYYIE